MKECLSSIKDKELVPRAVIPGAGLILMLMELFKQIYLYEVVFEGHYNVWYLPFQLCSMPMYMALLSGICCKRGWIGASRILWTFMQDFGILGGIAALIVHDGFTWEAYPLLTAHGYIWHIMLILMGLCIYRYGLSELSLKGFISAVLLLLFCAAIAQFINISLHGLGDCDMFYISPYHLSAQPVFRDIDACLGRVPGICIYLACMILGGGLIHLCFSLKAVRRRLLVVK